MTVAELIERLRAMPQDRQVLCVWDGEPRTNIQFVWPARGVGEDGDLFVLLAGLDDVVYDTDMRPDGAHNGPYWHTPDKATSPPAPR